MLNAGPAIGEISITLSILSFRLPFWLLSRKCPSRCEISVRRSQKFFVSRSDRADSRISTDSSHLRSLKRRRASRPASTAFDGETQPNASRHSRFSFAPKYAFSAPISLQRLNRFIYDEISLTPGWSLRTLASLRFSSRKTSPSSLYIPGCAQITCHSQLLNGAVRISRNTVSISTNAAPSLHLLVAGCRNQTCLR